MKTKRAEAPCDYRAFSDPYTGLATMIFVQADSDLKMLNGAETAYKGGCLLRKWEIINFFRSQWAATLADGVGLDMTDVARYTAEGT